MELTFCWFSAIILSSQLRFTQAAPPTITGLPTTLYVGELENIAGQERFLYTYTISDQDKDAFTCVNTITASPNAAAGDEFNIRKDSSTGEWKLYLTAAGAASLDTTTAGTLITSYANVIQCTDAGGAVTQSYTVTVSVVPGELLTLPNVEGTGNSITLDALATTKTTLLKTLTASSQGGNLVNYTLVSNPSFSPEFFKIDSSTGQITANRDLKYLDSSTPTVYLTVKAHDTVDLIDVYKTQIVNLNNQNTVPRIVNLDPTVSDAQLESLAVGTVLFTLTIEDPDTTNTHSYRVSCTPPDGDNSFTIDANGNVILSQALDYESITFYTCDFYVDDSISEGGPFTYELTVQDANESPTFADNMYYASTSEASAGSVSFDPGFSCTDQDAGDSATLTYGFHPANNSQRFAINSAGVMTFKEDYDVDNSNMPSPVILTVYCIDDGGTTGVMKTGSSQVTVTISDTNDNTPTFASTAYTIGVSSSQTAGSQIGAVTATDADSGTNADLSCSGTSSSAYSAYYTVGADCKIYLSKTPDFASGTTVTYVTRAVDKGNPAKTGTTTVDIIYQDDTTTTTTTAATTTAYNFFDHGENIAMFVLTLLMGLALLGALLYCCLRMCCGGGGMGGMCSNMCDCRQQNRARRGRYPPRQVTPDSKVPATVPGPTAYSSAEDYRATTSAHTDYWTANAIWRLSTSWRIHASATISSWILPLTLTSP
ncbi:protein dachsous-like isoform X4 [Mya arenaria]|uniref:protein dachsous-like isoform X4 n=1 Tax=Mya arenaria TaxID=6604 RepID=UPI0022E2DCBE|nr:protein dachsous-like isoform X4 [Mya arenaria]